MKLLDQGTIKSMVVNSEDVLNLIAGRSYSAGGHNLHFSTRILKHVRILTPDTNSEARANSDIWHEFWSTREFWHHFISSCSLMFGTRKFWHQNRWQQILSFFPYPYSGLSQRVAPSISILQHVKISTHEIDIYLFLNFQNIYQDYFQRIMS